eukprot:COSAG05_NODE_1654_length_4332_cov_9.405150_4_plen_56_part_00
MWHQRLPYVGRRTWGGPNPDPYDYGRSYLLTPIVLLSNIILVTIGNIHLSMLLND